MSNEKFRVWDSVTLSESAKLALQLKQKIEEICLSLGKNPEELPDSVLDTDRLYMLSISFIAAYDKLTEYNLLKTGNIKQTKNTH